MWLCAFQSGISLSAWSSQLGPGYLAASFGDTGRSIGRQGKAGLSKTKSCTLALSVMNQHSGECH